MCQASEPVATGSRAANRSSGLTLVELLLAVAILSLIAGALGALARTVSVGSQYSANVATSVQHARVTLERIARTVESACANESFPGAIVVTESVAGLRHPNTLVVWRPQSAAADRAGLPRFNELVIYSASNSARNELYEFTAPSDTRTAPAIANTAAWQSEIAALKVAADTKKTLLTDRLRVSSSAGEPEKRGTIRFEAERRPTASEWAAYRAGTTAWDELPWPQGIYGAQAGMSQTWVRIELQMVPFASSRIVSTSESVLPLFGSGAVYFELQR
jgi:prepilin-type N-terminal cleavage/methylation domain-containing protein